MYNWHNENPVSAWPQGTDSLTDKKQAVLILGWLEMYLSGNIWISIFPHHFGLDELPGYPTYMSGISVLV